MTTPNPDHKWFNSLRPAEQRLLLAYVECDFSLVDTYERLGISRHTFRAHLNRIFDLLEVHDGTKANKGAMLRVLAKLFREGSIT